jgi:hypothetical protein
MLATGVRRLAITKQPLALARTQRRFGGSLHKNPHVEVRSPRAETRAN